MVTGATLSPIGSQADLYFQEASFGEALQQANHVLFLEGKLVLLFTLFVAKQICKSFTGRLVNFRAEQECHTLILNWPFPRTVSIFFVIFLASVELLFLGCVWRLVRLSQGDHSGKDRRNP